MTTERQGRIETYFYFRSIVRIICIPYRFQYGFNGSILTESDNAVRGFIHVPLILVSKDESTVTAVNPFLGIIKQLE